MSQVAGQEKTAGDSYAIYGSGGFGRGVLPLVPAGRAQGESGRPPIVFVEDDPSLRGTIVNGTPVISFADLCAAEHCQRKVTIAIADGRTRQRLVNNCERAGLSFFDVKAADCLIYTHNRIAEGHIFCARTMVTVNATIGRHFQCNIFSYVEHDCEIGDFVTFAPRVCCNGRVSIGDYAYLGTGAIIKQGQPGKPLRIGAGAIVGMGAVVTADVPPGVVVVGNPARIIRDA